ncbi:LysM peptidoglycan-binding domain-containing protein [Periweissella fabaria]|uniref:LysM domain-containing protein n=1 Tax=Periweissella fabaria TaxID=546157 RepID=A0ABM8Z671_9LACO|nr:LysM peptidoglycan-binding domain-containing protein [Periweissella fabaria]MCM0597636.1 LysM peptidoglycan-binding domain-containing protein [Periweissella fabaria]CAH0416820.1 hypothetical protein WFA24289_01133 [Periweissella fabaria]
MNNLKKMILTGTGLVAALISTGVVANADSVITVQQGDTVSKLALENNTTIEAIVNANKLSNANLIFVNQKLNIPSAAQQAQQAPVQQVAQQAPVAKQAPVQQVAQQAPAQAAQQQAAQQAQQQAAQVAQQQAAQRAQQQAAQQQAAQQQAAQRAQQQAAQQQAAAQQTTNGSDAAAKQWIASHESGNNYNARNGQFIGMYQLSASYLGGDYSPANQERVANQYVQSRYGSWTNAKAFWQSHNWY